MTQTIKCIDPKQSIALSFQNRVLCFNVCNVYNAFCRSIKILLVNKPSSEAFSISSVEIDKHRSNIQYGVLKHFALWDILWSVGIETFCTPCSYFGLGVLKHFACWDIFWSWGIETSYLLG